VIKARFGDRLDALIERAFPFLFRHRLSPNALTVAGTLVSAGAAVAFGLGAFPLAGALLLGGGCFDLVDGVVARHQGRTTRFGAFLDSTLDRLVDMGVLLGVVMYFSRHGDLPHVLLAGVALVSSVMVSYAKARAETLIPSLSGGFFERGERVVVLALGGLTGLLTPALWVVAVGSSLTAAQRMALAYRALAEADAHERARAGEHS